jgi:hypothetical protein
MSAPPLAAFEVDPVSRVFQPEYLTLPYAESGALSVRS